MMPIKINNLRFKINGTIFLTFAAIAIISSVIMYPFEINRRRFAMKNIETLLSAVFQQQKNDLANEIFADQKLALKESLKEIRKVRGIIYIDVFDLKGVPLLSINKQSPQVLSPIERTRLKSAPVFEKTVIKGNPVARYSTIIEVIGERVGYLNIYYDLTDIEKEYSLYIIFFLSFLGSTLVVMSLFLNISLSKCVIRPASILRDAIGKVRRGDLGQNVNIETKSEIGQIAEDFNEMSKRLYQQHMALTNAIKEKDSYAQELEALNSNLEIMVGARTAALKKSYEKLQEEIKKKESAFKEKTTLEAKLARSKKMEALGLLAGGVAHDLNNVLSGIVSYPDLLLLDLPEDSPLIHPIKTMKSSGQRAAAIVQDLLTLARRGVINKEVLNLNHDIVMEYLNSPEHAKMMRYNTETIITTNLFSELMNIQGSKFHLKKVLMNLVSNALEAQPDGGEIVISTKNKYVDQPLKGYQEVLEGDYVVLSVKDSGIGIAAEDLEKIFEPFFTKKVMGRSGTGLGMTVVWGTVQDHDGYITIKSTERTGTTFELYFPATREEIENEQLSLPFEEYIGQGEKVLVVDDVKEQREIASKLLSKLGYKVEAASSGEEAVDFIKKEHFDILVLDMIMEPGIDGLETYRIISKIRPDQKAVIASGFAENERVTAAQNLGAGIYIRKPYSLEKIGMAIKAELNKKQG